MRSYLKHERVPDSNTCYSFLAMAFTCTFSFSINSPLEMTTLNRVLHKHVPNCPGQVKVRLGQVQVRFGQAF